MLEIILGLIALIAGGITVYVKGRVDATKKRDAELLKRDLAAERKRNDSINTAEDIRRGVDSAGAGDVRERLSDRWTRDN